MYENISKVYSTKNAIMLESWYENILKWVSKMQNDIFWSRILQEYFTDTGTTIHESPSANKSHLGPILLTWINFNPNMDM